MRCRAPERDILLWLARTGNGELDRRAGQEKEEEVALTIFVQKGQNLDDKLRRVFVFWKCGD